MDPPAPAPAPAPAPIRTPRLLLRAARASDLDALHGLFSDEDVMRYWSCPPHTHPAQTSTYLSTMLASPTNGTLDFVIVLVLPSPNSSPSTLIGKAGIWDPTTCEIGFMLHPAHWSKGYMREALEALVGDAGKLWERGVERVVADVDPRNGRSRACLAGLGFVEIGGRERTVRTHLGWCDSVFLERRGPAGGEGEGGG